MLQADLSFAFWFQFRTEVYSLLSLGYFIHLWLLSGCYLANYRVLFMSGISVFGTSVQVQHRCAGPAQVCRSCTDIPYLVVWLFIQFSAAMAAVLVTMLC